MSELDTSDEGDLATSEFSPRRAAKIGIVGAGTVGATMAFAALNAGVARTVALFDINRSKVEAEALDLSHGIQFLPMAEVLGSDDIEVLADSDVIVFTAGAKQKPGQSRLDLAEATIALVAKVLPDLVRIAPNAVHVMVTNPVDVVTYAALKISGLPTNQLFGSGTLLDSSRLRYLIAAETSVAVQSVHAWVVGEHGDTEIPLWSIASLGGVPLLDWKGVGKHGPLTPALRDEIAHEVVSAAYRIIEGKGATNYAIGLAGTQIVESILKDEHRVLPVSSLLDDYFGISDVCLSVPTVVGASGVGERLPVPMSPDELDGLRRSADAVREVARRFGY